MLITFIRSLYCVLEGGRRCDELTSAFAAVPGLTSKTWLANEETNTYGSVYLWKDKQAMLDYQAQLA